MKIIILGSSTLKSKRYDREVAKGKCQLRMGSLWESFEQPSSVVTMETEREMLII